MEIVFTLVGTVTCSIIILTVFFTLWRALTSKIKGPAQFRSISKVEDLPSTIDLILNDGRRYEGVSLSGVLQGDKELPWGMAGMLCVQQKGRRVYIRPDSIRVMEERENAQQADAERSPRAPR